MLPVGRKLCANPNLTASAAQQLQKDLVLSVAFACILMKVPGDAGFVPADVLAVQLVHESPVSEALHLPDQFSLIGMERDSAARSFEEETGPWMSLA